MLKEIGNKICTAMKLLSLAIPKYKYTKQLIHKYNELYGKGDCVIIYPPQGLGDILACCCALEYLKFKEKNVFVAVRKKYFLDIKDFFPKNSIRMILVEKDLSEFPRKGYLPLSLKMYHKIKPFISMKHNMCQALDLSPNVILNNQYEKKKEFNEIPPIREQKTIVISPFAVSCKEELSFDFWDNLANRLEKKGYDVIFNASSNSYYSKQYKTCLLNLEDTVELVTRSGYFIGWRSGLCDVIGMFSKAQKIIIYPSKPHKVRNLYIPVGATYPEAYMRSCSLKEIWNIPAVEIINNVDILNQIDNEFDDIK